MSLLNKISSQILSPIVYLLIALALIYFFWGVFIFVKNADNPTERATGYEHMKWGIVGLFIMVAVNGIINLIMDTVKSVL
jgi:hypothetical protein